MTDDLISRQAALDAINSHHQITHIRAAVEVIPVSEARAQIAAAFEMAAGISVTGEPEISPITQHAIRKLTPADAEAALQRVVDAAWNDAIEAAARVQDIAHQEGANAAGQHHAILALKRPEASHE